jgi:hypothetical protein
MTLPGIYLGMLVSTGMALIFHFIRGGALGRLLLYLMTGWLAFFLGHYIGEWLDWHLLRIGPINMFPAVFAAVTGLLAASVLVGPEAKARRRKGRKRSRRG